MAGNYKYSAADVRRFCREFAEWSTVAAYFRAHPDIVTRSVYQAFSREGLRPSDYTRKDPATREPSARLDQTAPVAPSGNPVDLGKPAPSSESAGSDELRDVLPFATPGQRNSINAMLAHGSVAAAAESLGYTPERLRNDLSEARRKAARAGWSPAHDMTKPVPGGFTVSGVSTYYGADGDVRGQWVKTKSDEDHRLSLLLDAVQTIAEPFRAQSVEAKAPRSTDADLLTVYPMGDPHLGMFAWAEETGTNFDLKVAESNLVAAVDHLANLAPPSDTALILNLGDFLHADDNRNRTARANHPLDVDGRWAKVLQVGVRTMRRCIDRALEKHKSVRVINAIGNHDDHSAVVLSVCLAMYYENNPRVTVDTSPAAFHWLRFGACLLGVTHGHNTKPAQLPGIMATDRAADWGETKFRYWYTGHVHHQSGKEYPGCIVETYRTLAPRDAWAHAAGYRSDRDMQMHVLHKAHGRINRHTVGIEQLLSC